MKKCTIRIGRIFGYLQKLLISSQCRILVGKVSDDHHLFIVVPETRTDLLGQVAAVVSIRQTVDHYVLGALVRTLIPVGVAVIRIVTEQ